MGSYEVSNNKTLERSYRKSGGREGYIHIQVRNDVKKDFKVAGSTKLVHTKKDGHDRKLDKDTPITLRKEVKDKPRLGRF